MISSTTPSIITVDSDLKEVLHKKAETIQGQEWNSVKEIVDKLFNALKPLMPAAGLAAPQIGISKRIFIYSFDRQENNLKAVINPSYEPVGGETNNSWEGCFSVILSKSTWKLAKVPRYDKIKVAYQNMEGIWVLEILEGFAAKVFQHEFDHLEGKENIDRDDAEIKEFESKEALFQFMAEVKKIDEVKYVKPITIETK